MSVLLFELLWLLTGSVSGIIQGNTALFQLVRCQLDALAAMLCTMTLGLVNRDNPKEK